MANQYALPLALPPVYAEENFVVSACNEEAHGWVMRWPNWPAYGLVIHGEPGSGKSHLAAIWHEAAPGGVLLEDIETITDERALLHTLNAAKETGKNLLITSALPPARLPFTLPDLTSRLRALPSVAILPPDEEALAAALRKQFADRQWRVEEEVIAYILPRIERSFASAQALVARLDEAALAEKRPPSVAFVRKWLEKA